MSNWPTHSFLVMPARSRLKDGVASLAYVAGISLKKAVRQCLYERDRRDI